jgi:hypothetical protein
MNIIELAREAGIKQAVENPSLLMVHELTRFAALVRAAAIEECAELMDGYDYRRLSAEIRALKERK